jgi:hypothetical protein
MRGAVRVKGKWQKVTLTDDPKLLSQWLRAHDGNEAIAIDDVKHVYYCGRHEMMQQYRDAWAAERKVGDKRKAAMFIDLDRQLFAKETPIMPDQSPAYCKGKGCLCSEVGNCEGGCL